MNSALAIHSLRFLQTLGVREYCICPGARNAPWIEALAENGPDLHNFYFYDERSAAFFALGRMRLTGNPVAVMTTSGTAAGELLAATMEAHYSGLPLVLLTADRPRRYRGSGAPQAAEQKNLFGPYVQRCMDFAAEDLRGPTPMNLMSLVDECDPIRPLHLNVCFEEPLVKFETGAFAPSPEIVELQSSLEKWRYPLAFVGALAQGERAAVARFLERNRIPSYFEGLSGLREEPSLNSLRLHAGDRIIERAKLCGYPVDGILRLGGVPTLRAWRDLEDKCLDLPVISFTRLPFSGLGRDSTMNSKGFPGCLSDLSPKVSDARFLLESDRHFKLKLEELLANEPRSEPGLFRKLSEHIPPGSRTYLGNSLPIREWDLAATWRHRHLELGASRGLNGIDGQISTFFGFSSPATENWGIFGDLTTLYDLSSPWVLPQLDTTRVNVVIINNGGGKIFERMFESPKFQNNHSLRFSSWAELWGMKYESLLEIHAPQTSEPDSRGRVIEVIPCAESTARFWKRHAEL